MRPALPWILIGAAACGAAFACSDDPVSSSVDASATAPPPGAPAPPSTGAPAPGPAPAAEPPPVGPAQPRFVGRFDTTDPAGPIATWPGARILARWKGTAISVTLREHAEDWMEGAPSYWRSGWTAARGARSR